MALPADHRVAFLLAPLALPVLAQVQARESSVVMCRYLSLAVAIVLLCQWQRCTVLLAADVTSQTVARDLSNPRGVAIRPGGTTESYGVVVADTGGGRIILLVSNQPELARDFITGFETNTDKVDPGYLAGPQGLVFLDNMRLIVAGGENGQAYVRLYELREPDATLKADQFSQNFEPQLPGDSTDPKPRGFHAIARTQANEQVPDLLIATSFGNDQAARLWKVPVRANTLGELEVFQAGRSESAASLAAGITVGTHGYVVSSATAAKSNSSRLVFQNPIDGKLALELDVNLPTIVGLAYSPSGRLYAASAAPAGQGQGGIYRIDDNGQAGAPACKAVRIAQVPNSTALAFGPDGTLWVTATGDSDTNTKSGTLLKLTGKL
jgi:hypothetical protein